MEPSKLTSMENSFQSDSDIISSSSVAAPCQTNTKSSQLDIEMPPKPEEPNPEDCCGQGCQPCVFDIYRKQVKIWEEECKRLKNYMAESTIVNSLSPISWSPFRCTNIKSHAADCNIYTFESAVSSMEFHFLPGQYLLARDGKTTRPYTPLPSDSPYKFDVLIKLYPSGRMSNFFRDLNIDSIVPWKGPFETGLSYKPNSFQHLVMFCAGTGLVPCYLLARSITSNEGDDTVIRMIFSCHTRHDLLLREQLRELRAYWNFSLKTFLTQDDGVGLLKWHGEDISHGRITPEVVHTELAGKSKVCVTVCGTKSFNKDVAGYVFQCQVPKSDVYIL